jgi:hypothetical protein
VGSRNFIALGSYGSIAVEKPGSDLSLAGTIASSWRILLSTWLVLWSLAVALSTFSWEQVNDPAQLHYACFLMDHGMSPYRDLIEMNMPGIYLANWTVMHALGGGSLAWRLFDFGLMGAALWAMIAIALPYDWFAGVTAGVMMLLFHARDGAMQLGQRDLMIAILLVGAHAFLFRALRSRSPWLMIGFGMCAGYSVTVKPLPAPYILLVLFLAALRFRQCGISWRRAVLWGLTGMAVPAGAVTAFLAARHSLTDFIWVARKTLPYYAQLGRQEWRFLLRRISPSVWGFVLIAALIFILECQARFKLKLRRHGCLSETERWELGMLVLGMFFGAVSFFAQGKGMMYHRYPFLAFVFMGTILYIVTALRSQGMVRALAAVGIAFAMWLAPSYYCEAQHENWSPVYIQTLTGDLNRLGGSALSGRVQCFTTEADCSTTLYRMRLVQSTGLFYDFLIFGPGDNPVIQHWRGVFWREFSANPPTVLIVHRGQYPNDDGYLKLSRWPEFSSFLEQNYVLYVDREFPRNHSNIKAYRIYVRKRSAPAAGADLAAEPRSAAAADRPKGKS